MLLCAAWIVLFLADVDKRSQLEFFRSDGVCRTREAILYILTDHVLVGSCSDDRVNWHMSGLSCTSSLIRVDVLIDGKKNLISWLTCLRNRICPSLSRRHLTDFFKGALRHIRGPERLGCAVESRSSQHFTGEWLIEARFEKYSSSLSCPKRRASVALRLVRKKTYVSSFWLLEETEIDAHVHITDLSVLLCVAKIRLTVLRRAFPSDVRSLVFLLDDMSLLIFSPKLTTACFHKDNETHQKVAM